MPSAIPWASCACHSGVAERAASARFERYAHSTSTAGQRVRRVTLTDAGREVVESGRAARAHLEAKLVEALGDEVIATAKGALAALIDAVGGIDDLRGRRVRARTV